MRKFFTMMISITLCFTMLAGCGSRDAYALYQAMNEALADVTSLDADMTINIQVTEDDETFTMIMDGNVKTIMHSDTDIDMHMVLTTSLHGDGYNESDTVTAFFTNGYIYMDMDGFRIRQAMNLDEAMEMANTVETLDFVQDAVIESSVSNISGGRRLELTLDGSVIPEINDLMADMGAMPGGMEDLGISVSLGNVIVEADVDSNNMLKSYRMVTDMTMEIDGYTSTTTIDMTLTVNSFNDVVINFPDDLDDYMDMGF